MNVRSVVDDVIALANLASAFLPQAKLVGGAAQIGEKILDIIDGVKTVADPSQQAAMQVARAKLADVVTAKAKATSDRLRGGGSDSQR